MVLLIGLGEDSYFDKIKIYPDGHWEKYKEKLFCKEQLDTEL